MYIWNLVSSLHSFSQLFFLFLIWRLVIILSKSYSSLLHILVVHPIYIYFYDYLFRSSHFDMNDIYSVYMIFVKTTNCRGYINYAWLAYTHVPFLVITWCISSHMNFFLYLHATQQNMLTSRNYIHGCKNRYKFIEVWVRNEVKWCMLQSNSQHIQGTNVKNMDFLLRQSSFSQKEILFLSCVITIFVKQFVANL